jgi:hypothetical protein
MGGEREATIETRPSKTKENSGKFGKLRFHENLGEIHFHDDAAGIKVAIPVALWSAAWEKLSSGQIKKFNYYDTSNASQIDVRIRRKKRTSIIEAMVEVSKLNFGAEFNALQKFTKG